MDLSKLIMAELQRLSAQSEKLADKFDSLKDDLNETLLEIEKEIVRLKMRASFWGLVAGTIPVAIAMAIEALKKK